MYITGAKFEEHCLNTSKVFLDWMLCWFSGTTYDVITFLICIIQKRKYLQKEKRYSQQENAILLYSEKPFKQARDIFYFIGTLKLLGKWYHKLMVNGIFCITKSLQLRF